MGRIVSSQKKFIVNIRGRKVFVLFVLVDTALVFFFTAVFRKEAEIVLCCGPQIFRITITRTGLGHAQPLP
jgi:hypothetical protein